MDLSKVDIIVGVDNSASMQNQSKRIKGTRFKEVEEMALGIASECAAFDSDGIDIITFGKGAQLQKGVTPDKVALAFAGGANGRSTDTHTLVEMAAARQKETGKPTVCIVFTDGDATDREATANAIVKATQSMGADEELSFGFVQVGDDPGATEFLSFLDDGLQKRGAKYDIVDTIPAHLAAGMSVPEMLEKFVQD